MQNDYDFETIVDESGPMEGVDIEFDMDEFIEWIQEDMRSEFRDYFSYAIMGDMWDETKPSECDDSCDAEYEMCCVQVAMKDQNTLVLSSERYCMTQESVKGDYELGLYGYDIKMACDKDAGKGVMNSSVRIVSGLFSAAVVIASLY